MAISRRGFLGLLLSGGVATVAKASSPISTVLKSNSTPSKQSATPEQLLIASYFPSLKANEGEVFNFYRCSAGKITVGYGTNVEDNPDIMKGVRLFYSPDGTPEHKYPIMEKDKNAFLQRIRNKANISEETLKKYFIAPEDAKRIAENHLHTFIDGLRTKYLPNLFKIPIAMQALALDVCYNVGLGKFEQFKNFRAALNSGDYETVVKESSVKVKNIWREERKSRSFEIAKFAHANRGKKELDLMDALIAYHDKNFAKGRNNLCEDKKTRAVNLKAEAGLVAGEYFRLKKSDPRNPPQAQMSARDMIGYIESMIDYVVNPERQKQYHQVQAQLRQTQSQKNR